MNKDRAKELGRKAAGAAVVVAGVGAGVWVSLIIADLLTFVWVYSVVSQSLDDMGVNIFAANVAGVLFAAFIAYLGNTVLLNIIKRNKRWVPVVAGVMVVWFGIMYVVAGSYTSGLFNPFSGEARAVYVRMPDGKIKSFPKGLKFDPDTGRPLKEFDPATAEEYQKQQRNAPQKSSWFWEKPAGPVKVDAANSSDKLSVWVEKIERAPDRTVVHFACEGKDGKAGWLESIGPGHEVFQNGVAHGNSSVPYLADHLGRTYDMVTQTGVYDTVATSGVGPWKKWMRARYVREGEVYRFTMTYPPLPDDAGNIRLHHSGFKSAISLDTMLENAERIPAIPPPPPVAEVSEPAIVPPAPTEPVPPPAEARLMRSGLRTGLAQNSRDELDYVWIPPGNFRMGCDTRTSDCAEDETPLHSVRISQGFWLGRTLVPAAAYQRVMQATARSFEGKYFATGTWKEAQAYCEAVGMRLPTEAEWEYAARGRHNLQDLNLGVWQWTDGWYEEYDSGYVSDPVGGPGSSLRALRGGFSEVSDRVSVRGMAMDGDILAYTKAGRGASTTIGFRCAGGDR